jgi:hypothetical protein
VTLVDGKDAFFHRIASLRASVDPAWTLAPFIPYGSLLLRGRVPTDRAVDIVTGDLLVVLRSGLQLHYNVPVIATRADYEEPARFTGTTVDEAAQAFTSTRSRGRRAEHHSRRRWTSGIELAAELRRTDESTAVKLAYSGPYLLSGTRSPKLGHKAQLWLEEHHVEVRLNTRI